MTKEELEAELIKRGIQINVAACGCCSSPWVAIKLDDKLVFQDENTNAVFKMIPEVE